ncbi:signal peptidase, partial [Clostridioides difficile]|uniref:signal peptidase n=1 Tax=Clostridioides difficile TaxID=1496 RepID=UPI001EEFBB14
TKWYVNRVGIQAFFTDFNSFILTKWYVNTIFLYSIVVILFCFILTKWYVNRYTPSTLVRVP